MILRKPNLGGILSLCHLSATSTLLLLFVRGEDIFEQYWTPPLALIIFLVVFTFPLFFPAFLFPSCYGGPPPDLQGLLLFLSVMALNSFLVGYGIAGLWKWRKTSRWPGIIILGVLHLLIAVVLFIATLIYLASKP